MTADTHAPRDGAAPHWSTLPDDQLLDVRLCDLDLSIQGSELEPRIALINGELESRGLIRPAYWISDEWFSPDGVPGVAVPFYLLHPRLVKLELAQMLEVEGGDEAICLKILRHEAGHAVDNAYQLRRRRARREIFGLPSTRYPEYYTPKPYSKSFVQHLDHWYAQSHPDEDFAETFAVWLDPQSQWRERYRGWPVLKKLDYVERLMAELAGVAPAVTDRQQVDPLRRIYTTLRDHYEAKRRHYGVDRKPSYDADLKKLFSDEPVYTKNPSAAAFLHRTRKDIRRRVAEWTGEYQYTIDQVLEGMIDRCQALRLRLTVSKEQAKLDFAILLTVQTMNYLQSGRHKVAL